MNVLQDIRKAALVQEKRRSSIQKLPYLNGILDGTIKVTLLSSHVLFRRTFSACVQEVVFLGKVEGIEVGTLYEGKHTTRVRVLVSTTVY